MSGDDFRLTSAFEWNESRTKAALALAEGKNQKDVAKVAEVTDRTIREWLQHPDFSAEVDRLTLMTGIASRAERLRIAKRVVQQLAREDMKRIKTTKDLLDWLKFAQSETDGIKLDMSKLLAALGEDEASLANSGSD